MGRLNKPHSKILSRENFNEYPIWVWDDTMEGYLPLSDSRYTSEFGTLFIKSIFIIKGLKFEGYLVGFNPFYAFTIFSNDSQFTINIRLIALAQKKINKLAEMLDCSPQELFPIYYRSSISLDNGSYLSGKFDLINEEITCIPDSE